jgi:type II secretory pathway component PulC
MVMKSPLWILNSVLACVLLLEVVFMSFRREEVPPKKSLAFTTPSSIKKDVTEIDISRIYMNDLFNTYIAPLPVIEEEEKFSVPTPPEPKTFISTPEEPLKFLPPLGVTVKGLIYVNNDRENAVILADNKTGSEALYRVGDTVEDAEVIRVEKDKALFIRPNGQQETLFLFARDAKSDPQLAQAPLWTEVVRKLGPTSYGVNKTLLSKRVVSLAQLIDMLDITTAFDRGVSIGARIGFLNAGSFGSALGLETGDVIVSINGVATTSTRERMSIYEAVRLLNPSDIVSVVIARGIRTVTYSYTIEQLDDEREGGDDADQEDDSGDTIRAVEKKNSRNQEKLNPLSLVEKSERMKHVVERATERDKKSMMQFGGRKTMIQRGHSELQ